MFSFFRWRLYLRLCHCLRLKSSDAASWTSSGVRSTFIQYFQSRDHLFVPSSSVIPSKTQGTYFTNAGMNQFKPLFLGTLDPRLDMASYRRAVNSQKCIRVGGKHNDLEEVGQDLTHHTFFEMLGSWSFGDYFKEDACRMAFELLTVVYGLPVNRLYFTYFGGNPQLGLAPDVQCRDLWRSLGVPLERILAFGLKENFWDMGDTGPCGPCTEIHFDHLGNGCRAAKVNAGSPDLVEIWNLVFMQYQRHEDGSLTLLPRQHVDTGMGLERMLAVLNGTCSNYDSDLFQPLFAAIQKASGVESYKGRVGQLDTQGLDTAYRILADHARMYTVAIADGLMPSRTGLGHKLRQLMHRCIRLTQNRFRADPVLLSHLVDIVAQSLGGAFPEIQSKKELVQSAVQVTVDGYLQLFVDGDIAFQKMLKHENSRNISGVTVMQLAEGRFGCSLPFDLIIDLADQYAVKLDLKAFEELRQREKEKQTNAPLVSKSVLSQQCYDFLQTQGIALTDDSFKFAYNASPDGYDFSECSKLSCKIMALFQSEEVTNCVGEGSEVSVVLDKTCFFAESGGQAADSGKLVSQSGEFEVKKVEEFNGYVVHLGSVISGQLNVGDLMKPHLRQNERISCMRNHTATHLVQAALRQHLGQAVSQQGSTVRPDRLTFDFLCLENLTADQVSAIERSVRELISSGHKVSRHCLPLHEAESQGDIIMMPNEDYPAEVTVVQIGDTCSAVSKELCGGTHVQSTADLVDLCITRVSSVSQGVRRVTAISGQEAKKAHKNGAVVIELCEEFSSLAASQTARAAELSEKSQHIKQMLETVVLPSTVRDQASRLLETLAYHVTAATNRAWQLEVRNLMEDLSQHQQTYSDCIVHSMHFDGKQMVKALSSVTVRKPIALISCDKKSSVVIVIMPAEQDQTGVKMALTKVVGESSPVKFKSWVNEQGASLLQASFKGSYLQDWLASSVKEAMSKTSSR